MTVSNEERHEIAENLRTMLMGGCKYMEEFYELLDETVMPDWDYHSFDSLAERLADLIEPEERALRPTLRQNEFGHFDVHCPKCYSLIVVQRDSSEYMPNYCPNCGCRVKEG